MTAAVFLSTFLVYLTSLPPSLAAYRDSGEMAASAWTLGVSHPTGYPLYILLGRAASCLPLADPAYRLALLSAAAAAAAAAGLYRLLSRRWGPAAGLTGAALLGLGRVFWSVAQAQEMYSLGVLAAVLLLALSWRLSEGYNLRQWRLYCFAYGLALTNRLDLVLWSPGLTWLALSASGRGELKAPGSPWAACVFVLAPGLALATGSQLPMILLAPLTALWAYRGDDRSRWALESAAWALAGLSLYAYLPLRSAGGPWLDWNHPAVPANFLETLLRTRYGGALDLLSLNYARGELFWDDLRHFARHLWTDLTPAGLLLAAAGWLSSLKSSPARCLGWSAAWCWCGPVFLLLANMPVNPHAAAILEPHYLLADLLVAAWAAEGALGLARALGRPRLAWAGALMMLAPLSQGRAALMDKRRHVFAYDFAKNVLRAVPPRGTVVLRKDVPLYSLWYYQSVRGWRPDARAVAQGLAGSPWYQAGWRRADASLSLLPLREASHWQTFSALNPPAAATPDCELPTGTSPRARGLTAAWTAGPAPWLWGLMPRRGRYAYDEEQDFFTSDLVALYSLALYRLGTEALAAGRLEEASANLRQAWAWQWGLPEAPAALGYLSFVRGDWDGAARHYGLALALYERLMGQAEEFRSLLALKEGLRRSSAEALMHLGAVAEKRGDAAAAEGYYRRSLERLPLAQARYNLAVLFWGRDPARAEAELREALRLDPGHAEAARYLRVLLARKSPH